MTIVYDQRGGYTPEFAAFFKDVLQPELEQIARKSIDFVKAAGGSWMDGKHADVVATFTLQREMEKQLDAWWLDKEQGV